MRQLQHDQHNGNVENDTKGSEDPDYEFPGHEKHLVHAKIEIPQFDPHTGQPLGVPKIQKYSPKVFKQMKETNGFAGYKVTVLHDPKDSGINTNLNPQTQGGQSLGDRHSEDNKSKLAGGFENGQNTAGKPGDEQLEKTGVAGNSTSSTQSAGTQGTGGETVVPFDFKKANKDQLTAKYTELYGEAPKPEWTKADLIEMSEEKIAFLAAEKLEADKAAGQQQ